MLEGCGQEAEEQVHAAEWDHATVFAPVLAIACASGPNLGSSKNDYMPSMMCSIR